jgi:cation diffusion facilitator CzcD-associated flavoprotein CzcO
MNSGDASSSGNGFSREVQADGSGVLDVLIAGAGFSGLGMAIHLRQEGKRSFLVIEKADDIGGTWYFNQYPGCACDIPSHLYSFSFDRNPEWSHMYSGRQEIHDYLKACAERCGLMPYIRLNTAMRNAAWDEASSLWRVTASDGTVYRARVLISAVGALHVPKYPEIKGLAKFDGPKFHSTYWDSSMPLEGKRVAVIGTGASAIQFVPEIAPKVERLFVFQRTPPWIVPKQDFAISAGWKKRFRRWPWLGLGFRRALFWLWEMRVVGFLNDGWLRRRATKMASEHLEAQVPDPKLRALLTPKYEFGCKRVLISNDFYPALQRPNVELVTDGISEVREHSIVTSDGTERQVDMLIYGTGFRATEPLLDALVTGRDGLELHAAWKDRISAYLGITVSGFPNFFILLGPNTGLGHNSVVLMSEAQIDYVMSCLKLMDRSGGRAIALKPVVQQRFVDELKNRLAGTVWQSGGCRSWYQDAATGENPVIWPGSVVSYQRRTRSAAPADYELTGKV